MEIQIIASSKKNPQPLNLKDPIINLTGNEKLTVVVAEGGMASGEPSVLIISQDEAGAVVLGTSLDKFLAAGQGMAGMAKNLWGWEQPEGYASFLPPDPETRKALLESIKKELEEWDETNPEGP